MMSQMIASPKLVTPPPPNIQAKQPMRFTARVALFTESKTDILPFRYSCRKEFLVGYTDMHMQKRDLKMDMKAATLT